ncbi:MAG: UDP-2,3-diacylglucosamine diphosphatase [Sulfurospirillum sp.]|nr:UDP-2,3-diacylglucosamine diphosphatase [Sulfurospirillum sp.]
MCHKILEGAIFIADAHENENRHNLWRFLLLLRDKKIQTRQLFLMGDMFDLLVDEVTSTHQKYKKYITLLEDLACEMEIFYFEGNHDFCLKNLFSRVIVIPIAKQPMPFIFIDTTPCLLAHGDKNNGILNSIYTSIIRFRPLLWALNRYDLFVNFKVSSKIEKSLLPKKICKKIENFHTIITAKMKHYPPIKNLHVIEGHYHQNESFMIDGVHYINLPSFACDQSYFIVECSNSKKFAQKNIRGYDV